MADLAKFRTNLQVDLGTSSNAEFSDAQVDRAVEKAVHDLSRILPKQSIKDVTNDWEITDETFTSDHGTAVVLNNKYIQPGSENVTNNAGTTTYARDTDYTMDYAAGTITTLAAGAMTDAATHKIDYTKHKVVISISDISGKLLHIQRVEFPAGQVPALIADYERWGDYLTIGAREPNAQGIDTFTQRVMGDNTHVWILYTELHTPPIVGTDGTYPIILDEIVHKGSLAYLLDMKVGEQLYLVETDLSDSNVALDKVNTHLVSETQSATNLIEDMTEANAELADSLVAFDAVAALIDEAWKTGETGAIKLAKDVWATNEVKWLEETGGFTDANAEGHLDVGADLINAINTGDRAAALRSEYALTAIEAAKRYDERRKDFITMASLHIQQATVKIAEGRARLESAQRRLEGAAAKTDLARYFIQEASQRVAMSERRMATVQVYANRADNYRREFLALLRDSSTWATDTYSLPRVGGA